MSLSAFLGELQAEVPPFCPVYGPQIPPQECNHCPLEWIKTNAVLPQISWHEDG
jgi:hypothetical protein